MKAADAGVAQDQGGDEHQAHEHAAVDRALDEAGAPMLPGRCETRRPPASRSSASRSGDRRSPTGRPAPAPRTRRRRRSPGTAGRPIARHWRTSGVAAATAAPSNANTCSLRADRRQPVDADQSNQDSSIASPMNQQHQRAPDRDLAWNGMRDVGAHERAELRHVPVGAERTSRLNRNGIAIRPTPRSGAGRDSG